MTGYVKLFRKVRHHWIWEKPEFFRAWSDMLMEAAWKPERRLIGDKLINVPRGGFVASERYLSDRWKWSTTKVRNFLKKLVLDEMIKREIKQGIGVVTICNYGSYTAGDRAGEADEEAGIEAETDALRKHGESELKKIKNIKKKEESRAPDSALIVDSGEVPPVSLIDAISHGETVMISKEIVTAWWTDRDALGWVRKQQPIRRWISDLTAFKAAWDRNDSARQVNGSAAKRQDERTGMVKQRMTPAEL